ncbi:MAG: hypothetical protein WBB07_01045 [Mycobacterium sp.]
MKKLALTIGAAAMLLPAIIGVAGPAQAAQGFVMPNTDGMNLQEAENAVAAAAHGIPTDMHSHNIKGMAQQQRSLTDWLVCNQKPEAGETITTASDVNFGVVREFDAARNIYDPMVTDACK